MPHTNNPHPKQEEAEQIVRDLLSRYLIVNTHDSAGGDPTEGMRLEQIFQSQQTLVIDLVAEGLTTGKVLF